MALTCWEVARLCIESCYSFAVSILAVPQMLVEVGFLELPDIVVALGDVCSYLDAGIVTSMNSSSVYLSFSVIITVHYKLAVT